MSPRALAGRAIGFVALAALLAPLLALPAAAVVDRGADGAPRASAFYLALTAADPVVWQSARNSLIVAGAATGIGLVLGVAAARAIATTGPRAGRAWAWALAATAATPPVVVAIGAEFLLGPIGDRDGAGLRWLALGWVETIGAAALVAMATLPSLRELRPSWIEAGLLAGAGRRSIWRDLAWPLARPAAARAAGAAFALVLLEPGGPLVLGRVRTLPSLIVAAALDPTGLSAPRAAGLALLGLALALAGRAAWIAWGGTPRPAVDPGLGRDRPRPDRPRRALGAQAALAIGLVALLAPVLALPIAALGGPAEPRRDDSTDLSAVADRIGGSFELREAALPTLALAAFLAIAGPATAAAARGSDGPGLGRSGWELLGVAPPLAIGVGALAIPDLLVAIAAIAPEGVATGLRALGAGLAPLRSPGPLLAWSALAAGWWRFGRGPRDQPGPGDDRGGPGSLRAMALSLGASPRQARQLAEGRSGLASVAIARGLAAALLAAEVAPALVLAPTAELRPIGPVLVRLAVSPESLPIAATAALALAILGWLVAAGRPAP